MLAASSQVPRKPRADTVPRELRLLASHVVQAAIEDALKGRAVSTFGLEPWLDLAGLPRKKLPEVLARARDGRLAARLAQVEATARQVKAARVGRPRGRPKGSPGRGVNGFW